MPYRTLLAALGLSLTTGVQARTDAPGTPAKVTAPVSDEGSLERFPPEALQPDDGLTTPPPGSPADQQLWRTSVDMNNELPLLRGEAAKVMWRVKWTRLDERLADLGKKGPPEAAQRADDVRRRLQGANVQLYELLVRQWPVDPTRVCRYAELDFTSALRAGPGADQESQRADARGRLRECLEKARVVKDRLAGEIQGLERTMAEAEGILPPIPPPPAPPVLPSGPPPPTPGPPSAAAAARG